MPEKQIHYDPDKNYDRSVMAFVFGILGLVAFFPLGIPAWVLGHKTGRAINDGVVPTNREGIAKSAKILGIVGIIVGIIWTGLLSIFLQA